MEQDNTPRKIWDEELQEIIEQCYVEFEASGFDTATVRMVNYQLRIWTPGIERAKAEGTPNNWAYKRAQPDWREFLEYALRRIPKDDPVLHELLLERVRDTWIQQRIPRERKHHFDLIKRMEQALNKTTTHLVSEFFYELRANQVIPPDRPRVEIAESGEIFNMEETADGDYPFGTLRNGVLTWTAHSHQLARAIHAIEPYLGYDTMTAYAICNSIEQSRVVVLKRGKFTSVIKYLEQIYRRKQQFGMEDFIPEAATMILSLLKMH
jgi:hypothetical protein